MVSFNKHLLFVRLWHCSQHLQVGVVQDKDIYFLKWGQFLKYIKENIIETFKERERFCHWEVIVVHQISHSRHGTTLEALYRRLTQWVPVGPRAVVLEEYPVKTSKALSVRRCEKVTGCLSRTPSPDSVSFDNPASSRVPLEWGQPGVLA